MALIALDYDGTYTIDPGLWDRFIKHANERGHQVAVVTCRRPTAENIADVQVDANANVFFTSMAAKRWYMEERVGAKVDVWIDDEPETVEKGK